jgi:hypothetical protein
MRGGAVVIALLPLLKHRATWGVGIALGVFVALASHGRLKYTEGHRDGVAKATQAAQADALTAKAVSDSAWAVLYAQAAAARDAERAALARVARAEARTRAATARVANALTVFAADTVAQMVPACAELAESCANAAALWGHERDTLSALIAAQGRALLIAGDLQATEPQRMADALRVALAEQRRTFRRPSRVRWLLSGVALGAVGALAR